MAHDDPGVRRSAYLVLAVCLLIIAAVMCCAFTGCTGIGTDLQNEQGSEFDQRIKEQEEQLNEMRSAIETDRRESSERLQDIEGVGRDLDLRITENRQEQHNYATKNELLQTTVDLKATITATYNQSVQKSENEGWMIVSVMGILSAALIALVCIAGVFLWRAFKMIMTALVKGAFPAFGE